MSRTPEINVPQAVLVQLLAQLESAPGTPGAALAILRVLATPRPRRARGRPPGSKNKHETHGLLRARAYFALMDGRMTATAAARSVARQFSGVSESTVFKDWSRHGHRVLAEHMSALRSRRSQAFLDDYPNQAAAILESWVDAFTKTADEVARLGNPAVAAYVREIAHDAALEALGKTYHIALRALVTELAGD